MRQPERERLRIAALRRLHPELAEALSFLETVTEVASRLVPADFDRSRLRLQDSDLPPLCPSQFALDEGAATQAFRTFLEALAESPDSTTAKRALAALENGRLVPRQLVRAYCERDAEVFERAAKQARFDRELLVNLAELAVKPQFVAAAHAMEIEVDKASRSPNSCPVCGSPPDLALITDGSDADGIMIAVCRLCESEWPVRRIVCLVCGNEDSETLSYLQAEGQEENRIYVCASCHHYLPVLDARGRREFAPAVERIALAHLEVVAQGQGAQPLSALEEPHTR